MFLTKNFFANSRNYKLQKKKNTTKRCLNKSSGKKLRSVCQIFSRKHTSVYRSVFPSDVKLTGVTSEFKKKSETRRDNCRPISILPNISKIYERCLYNQIQTFFNEILSKSL